MTLTLAGLDNDQLGHITNGCGGGWFDVPDWVFHAACQQHDLDYWIGCTEEDRIVADKNFYIAMKDAASKQSWYKRWFYYSLAYTYYCSVRVFTRSFFYYGPQKRTHDDLVLEMGLSPNNHLAAEVATEVVEIATEVVEITETVGVVETMGTVETAGTVETTGAVETVGTVGTVGTVETTGTSAELRAPNLERRT